jgi:hypothetical protein
MEPVMLTKMILIGLLASLFYPCIAGAVVAGDNDKPSVFSGDQVPSMYMNSHGIEFAYSPMVESSQTASVSPGYMNNENIEFDYSPRKDSNDVDSEGTAKPIVVCATSPIDTLPQNQADYCRRML